MKIEDREYATTGKTRSVPKWVLAAIGQERAEAKMISCPRARRVREIEIDLKEDAIVADLRKAVAV